MYEAKPAAHFRQSLGARRAVLRDRLGRVHLRIGAGVSAACFPMKSKALYAIARQELDCWKPSVNRGLVMAILWAFIHRLTTGESIEETFGGAPKEPEYHI